MQKQKITENIMEFIMTQPDGRFTTREVANEFPEMNPKTISSILNSLRHKGVITSTKIKRGFPKKPVYVYLGNGSSKPKKKRRKKTVRNKVQSNMERKMSNVEVGDAICSLVYSLKEKVILLTEENTGYRKLVDKLQARVSELEIPHNVKKDSAIKFSELMQQELFGEK